MTRKRYAIPRGCRRVKVGWQPPDSDESFVVLGYLTPSYPGRGPDLRGPGWPDEPAEFGVLAVVEDRPGGVERPELLDLVEQDIDDLAAKAEEEAADREAAAIEDKADARREGLRMVTTTRDREDRALGLLDRWEDA